MSNLFLSSSGSVLQLKPGSDVVISVKNSLYKCDETLNLVDDL